MRRLAPLLALATLLLLASAARSGDDTCRPEPVTVNTPSGIAGCTLDGPTAGKASWYHGTVAAAQWCVYPWKHCQSVSVTANGHTIIVTPGSFCDCWWLTDRRLIDLTPAQFESLGVPLSAGLVAVVVTPLTTVPDTAMRPEVQGWIAVYALLVFACFALLLGVDRRR